LKALIEKLRSGAALEPSDIRYAISVLVADKADDELKADFLTALHQKGETPEEIVGFVEALMERAIDPMIDPARLPGPMVDVCGTGGDGLSLFNVSTTITFILAAAGVPVVKHGNRGVTSLSGSADVLEALGIRIHLTPDEVRQSLEQYGLTFIFARAYHPAFRALAAMREHLARKNQRTIFNLLGPLLNPARPPRQLIGVFAQNLTGMFAEVLRRMGRERGWIVHGLVEGTNGMDDISISGPTIVAELEADKVTSAVLDTQWLGLKRCPIDQLRGGNATENAATIIGILSGEDQGAKREMTVANAAGGFVVAGLARDLREGIVLAQEQIDSGRALEKLKAMQNFR
jgi:anthranilate phosphoribosyltransferase